MMRFLYTVSLCLAFVGCQTPPAELRDSLLASTDLHRVSPIDIAVLPVEDATADRSANHVLDSIRAEIARSLVSKMYTPLAFGPIDRVMQTEPGATPTVSVVDAEWQRRIGGRFGEDASLAVRVTLWDQSSLMSSGRVRMSADVSLVGKDNPNPLWFGALQGEVKAGGNGPAPRDRASREQAAGAEFARELVRRLPRRRP